MVKIVQGDVLKSGADAILHQVNCQGAMNSGVAKQVRLKHPTVFRQYKELCRYGEYERRGRRPSPLLGEVQAVEVGEGKYIVNLFAQDYYGYDGKCYTDYNALRSCLRTVNQNFCGRTVAIPFRMSCDRGGADWDVVYAMIEEELHDCDVTIYRLGGEE